MSKNAAGSDLAPVAPKSLRNILSAEERVRFRQPRLGRLAFDFSLPWLQIALGFGLFAWSPGALTFVLAFVMIAGGQQGLLLCGHEFAHYLVVPGNRRWNDAIGTWLFAAPAGLPLALFRHRHFKHHRLYSTDDDTKTLYRQPIEGSRFWRLVLRNLTGYEYVHHFFEVREQSRREEETGSTGPGLFEVVPPVLIAQAVVLTAFIPLHPLWYGALWVAPLLTLVPLYGTLRAIMEHQPPRPAPNAKATPYFRDTKGPFVRSVRASLLERLTVAKIHFGYHAEHHLYPQVSYQYLPELHRRLVEQNAFADDRLEREGTYWSAIQKLRRDEPESFRRPPVHDIPKTRVPECPACESSSRRPLLRATEHEYTTTTDDEFTMMVCDDCGVWYLDPRPDKSALDLIYPPNYYAYVLDAKTQSEIREKRRGVFSGLASWLFKQRIAPIARHLELGPESRWLDIGCGSGSVLEWMKEEYGAQGTGLDLSEAGVRHCMQRGFEAHVGRFEDWDAKGETYDLVLSSHVIEHVESPLAYMRKAFELLNPGGVCAFFTPNTDTWEARLFGRHWGGLHVPRHWALLDAASARSLGERAGFDHLETRFSTNGTFWTWSFHSLLLPVLGQGFADWLLPSDHRFIEPNVRNVVRIGLFTAVDVANLLVQKRSANMLAIFRKP